MKTAIQVIAIIMMISSFSRSEEVDEFARKSLIVSTAMVDLYSYSIRIDNEVKLGKDITRVRSDNAKWLARIIAQLESVTTLKSLIKALEQRVNNIKNSGGLYQGHPDFLRYSRPLEVLKGLDQQRRDDGVESPKNN